MIAFCFYDCCWLVLLCPVIWVFVCIKSCKQKEEAQIRQLEKEFVDALKVISVSLLAGLSMENSWKEAEKEIRQLYGKSSVFYPALHKINQQVEYQIPLENALVEFAEAYDIEDVRSFAETFVYAKRSGGDYVRMIATTTDHLREKWETEQEIQIEVAGKRFEQKIMTGMPVFILLYLRVSAGDYLQALYHNLVGILVMTIALFIYGLAIYLSERIMRITF